MFKSARKNVYQEEKKVFRSYCSFDIDRCVLGSRTIAFFKSLGSGIITAWISPASGHWFANFLHASNNGTSRFYFIVICLMQPKQARAVLEIELVNLHKHS